MDKESATNPGTATEINLSISCPLHPEETVERVCIDSSTDKEILCVECLLGIDDPTALSQSLVRIGEFVDIAAKFYESSKKAIAEPSEAPQEFVDLVEKQSENIEKIAKHIESQKKRIEERFNTLIEEFTKLCKQKKDEYITTLDKQLQNFRYNYIFFEKQLRKLYPKEAQEDASLYPSKEAIIAKLEKLTNSTQLLALVKNIKQDLNEAKYNPNNSQESQEEARKKVLSIISKSIQNNLQKLPQIITAANYSQDKLVKDLKDTLDKSLLKFLEVENEIFDMTKGSTMPDSKILTNQDQVTLIRKWLKRENMGLKLLYRATRDGFNGNSFHSKCDGKGETITLIKTENTGKIFGGYLDKNWETKEAWINSSKAFVFSINNKEMYPLKSGHEMYAAYAGASYGPSFGGGYDFHISGKSGGALLYSFEIGDINKLTGGSSFTCAEIEVFQITKEAFFGDSSSTQAKSTVKEGISSEAKKKVAEYLGVDESKFKLLYKGSQDGMDPETFHDKCDNAGPTVVFIRNKEEDDIIGGYTTQPWCKKEMYALDYEAFVFSIKKNQFYSVAIAESAIFQSSAVGPYFGDDETLVVFKEKQNGKWNVVSNAYDCYNDGANFSGGCFNFVPDEVEVYEIPW